jgi:hypothetical protein
VRIVSDFPPTVAATVLTVAVLVAGAVVGAEVGWAAVVGADDAGALELVELPQLLSTIRASRPTASKNGRFSALITQILLNLANNDKLANNKARFV